MNKPKKIVKCGCREAKRHDDCSYCGMGCTGQICGICKSVGIDGPVIKGTSRTVCKIHKKNK